jgi:hypothetical protein
MKQTERVLFEKEVATKVQGRYKTRVFDANNELVREQKDWAPNLILDCGLDKIAYMPWANVFQFAVCGTGTTPTKVDTSSNAQQSGTDVTIQSGTYSFTPAIVGKLLYWPGTDKYAKVLSYTDPNTVVVDTDQVVSSALFYVYNVDQTALATPYSMQCRYVPGTGLCGTTVEGNTVKLLRTFDFYLENTPVLITEVGFKDQPAAEKLFSRVVLQEPQFLAGGQYFQISYELAITLEPGTPTTRTVDVSGWPVSPASSVGGTEMIQSLGMAVVNLSGVTEPYDQSFLCNEPYAPGTWYLSPEYGYTNRWQNGAAYPTKVYPALSASPFAYKRNYVDYYLQSDTGSYIPRISAATYNGTTTTQTSALVNTYNVVGNWPQQLIALSAEYMVPVISVPNQWGRVSTVAETSSTTFSQTVSTYLGAYILSGVQVVSSQNRWTVALKFDSIFKSDIPAQVVGQTILDPSPDISSPVYNPATYTYAQWLTAVGWPELVRLTTYTSGVSFNITMYKWLMPPYDPFVEFPAPVYQAEFAWPTWTHTFSPSASGLLVTGSSVFMSNVSAAPASFGTCVDRSAVNAEIPLTIVPYVTGSFERIKKATFLTNFANRTDWYTIGIGPTDTSINVTDRVTASKYNGYVYVFDEPQTKYDTHILNVFFKYSWRRDLST